MIREKLRGIFDQTIDGLLKEELRLYKATQFGVRAISYPVSLSFLMVYPILKEKCLPFYGVFNVCSFLAIWLTPALYTIVPESRSQQLLRRVWDNPGPVYDEILEIFHEKVIGVAKMADRKLMDVVSGCFAIEDIGRDVARRGLRKIKKVIDKPESLIMIQSMIGATPESLRKIYY